MPIGLVGKKCGMMQLFTEAGELVPVTVVEVLPNRVSQVKREATDGYEAVQLVGGKARVSKLSKAQKQHFAKANIEAGNMIKEFRITAGEYPEVKLGDQFKVDVFSAGQVVDVRGVSRGKGFAGTVKRYNFRMQDASHGNSLSHRAPGSMGQNQSPGRVFPGKRMAGHMGHDNCTSQNLQVGKGDVERKL